MKLFFALLIAISSTASAVYSNTGAGVQLFEWSWADVATECENYLSKKGFKAVQVSPPMEHIQGSQWWTRYQPVTYTLESRSGSEAAFKSMVSRCNAVNVSIIVDAVINHMAAGSGTGTAGSKYGSRQYPNFGPQDFHHNSNDVTKNCQVSNYNDRSNVQNCDLVGLPDLQTSSEYVQTQIAAYINKLANYGVKGIRIDAAKHQDATELGGIVKRLPAHFYVGQEVIGSPTEPIQPKEYYGNGQVTEFMYASYLADNVAVENKMIYLKTFGESWGLATDKYAIAFTDNHDTQRNGQARITYKNGDLYTFANVFMLAWPYGNIKLMSSYYFTDTDMGPPSVGPSNGKYCSDGKNWVCEHRWGPIGNMVAWRNTAGTADIANWQEGNANQIAFSRNGKAFIALNRGSSSWTVTLQTGLPQGTYCNIIGSINDDNVATCPTVTVGADGRASVVVPALNAVAMHTGANKE